MTPNEVFCLVGPSWWSKIAVQLARGMMLITKLNPIIVCDSSPLVFAWEHDAMFLKECFSLFF
jgi:hypothetical protein